MQPVVSDDVEIVREMREHPWICPSPGIDGLLVIADREHVAVLVGKLADYAILHRIQVLEFVHEDCVPTPSDGSRHRCNSEELRGLEKQSIEIDDGALGRRGPIAGASLHVAV